MSSSWQDFANSDARVGAGANTTGLKTVESDDAASAGGNLHSGVSSIETKFYGNLSLLGSELDDRDRLLRQMESEVETLQERLHAQSSDARETHSQLAQARRQLSLTQGELEESQASAEHYALRTDELERDLAALTATETEIKKRLTAQHNQSVEDAAKFHRQLSELAKSAWGLEIELSASRSAETRFEADVARLKAELGLSQNEVQRAAEKSKAAFATYNAQLSAREIIIGELEHDFAVQLQELEQSKEAAHSERTNLEFKIQTLEQERNFALGNFDDAEERIETTTRRLNLSEEAVVALKIRQRSIENELLQVSNSFTQELTQFEARHAHQLHELAISRHQIQAFDLKVEQQDQEQSQSNVVLAKTTRQLTRLRIEFKTLEQALRKTEQENDVATRSFQATIRRLEEQLSQARVEMQDMIALQAELSASQTKFIVELQNSQTQVRNELDVKQSELVDERANQQQLIESHAAELKALRAELELSHRRATMQLKSEHSNEIQTQRNFLKHEAETLQRQLTRLYQSDVQALRNELKAARAS